MEYNDLDIEPVMVNLSNNQTQGCSPFKNKLKIDKEYLDKREKKFGNYTKIDDAKDLMNEPYKNNKNLWTLATNYSNPYELVEVLVDTYGNPKKINDHTQDHFLNNNDKLYTPYSRAFYKLYEILHFPEYKQILQTITRPDGKNFAFHVTYLAEGPGGWIDCIDYIRNSHRINKNYKYKAITLYEKNPSVNLPKYLIKNLVWGTTEQNNELIPWVSGNLYYSDNIKALRNSVGQETKGVFSNLVTADGGISAEKDWNNQELTNMRLFFAEVVAAFATQARGGTFILKIYEIFNMNMAKLLYLLGCYYKIVDITKPVTSRPNNSEKYIICQNFKGISEKELNELYRILDDWGNHENTKNYILFPKFDLPDHFTDTIFKFNVTIFIPRITRSLLKTFNTYEYFRKNPQIKLEDFRVDDKFYYPNDKLKFITLLSSIYNRPHNIDNLKKYFMSFLLDLGYVNNWFQNNCGLPEKPFFKEDNLISEIMRKKLNKISIEKLIEFIKYVKNID